MEADALQADYFVEFFAREREDLLSALAAHVKRLTASMTMGSPAEVGHYRRCVRMVEREIRAIDRMVAALRFRFSEDTLTRRA